MYRSSQFLILFALILLLGCEKKSNLYLIKNIEKPQFNKITKQYELESFDNYWKIFSRHEYELSKELLRYKGDTKFKDSIFTRKYSYYLGGMNGKSHLIVETNEIEALYFISALYYNNYYFASDKILYSLDSIPFNCTKIYDPFLCLILDNTYAHESKDSRYTILTSSAWNSVEKWLNEVDKNGLDKMRELKISPLSYANLKWIGEEGGFMNCNYPGRFCKNYERIWICPTLLPATNRRFRFVH